MSTACFIVPSWHYYKDPLKHTPYWELYYATYVKKAGLETDVIDIRSMKENNKNLDLTKAVNKIPGRNFYFYWIFKSGDALEIFSIVKLLKNKYPKSIHAAGGTHVDMCQDECVKHFDSIIVGPGEESFIKVIKDCNENKLLKKYSTNYKSLHFSDTHFPDRSFLSDNLIANNKMFDQYGKIKSTLTYFSRGCMMKCAFCTYNVPHYLQIKKPELVTREIKYLKERYNIKGLLVKDEVAISPNKKISTKIMEAIGNENIIWRGQTTTMATYEQLKLAKESGCVELAFGVETVDDNVMKIIDKTWQNQKSITRCIEDAKKVGINVKICLILGLPGEKKDIADSTLNFLREIKPNYVSVSGFLPVPGSPIARNFKKFGIKMVEKDWNKYAHLLYRFSDEEEVGLPFEFNKITPWGKSLSNSEIKENVIRIQTWLRENSMVY